MIAIKYSLWQYVVRLSLKFILFIVFFFVLFNSTISVLNVLPNGGYYNAGDAAAVSFHDLYIAQDQLDSVRFNGITQDSAFVSGVVDPSVFEETNLVYTDENFAKTHPFQLQQGAFFSTRKTQFNRTDVVISSDLAFHLFMSLENIVGRKMYVNDLKLTVVGVYYSDSSLINRLSGNGLDTVYVPYYSVLSDGMVTANEIIVSEQTGEESLSSISEAEANDALGRKLNYYSKMNFGIEKRLLWQGFQFFLLVAAVILCVYLFVLLQYNVRKNIAWWKNVRVERRAVGLREILTKFIWPAVFVVAILALLILSTFELYLPFKLNSTTIFDLGFYVDYFVERFLSLRGIGVSFYGNYVIWTTMIQVVSGLFLLVFEIRVLRWLHMTIKPKVKLS